MGTTTQALQMVKYLLFRGRKACYLQMNGSNFIGALKQNYEIASEGPSIGKVTYQNVDLFEKQDKISHALKLGYDFYIYDYGVLSSRPSTGSPFWKRIGSSWFAAQARKNCPKPTRRFLSSMIPTSSTCLIWFPTKIRKASWK